MVGQSGLYKGDLTSKHRSGNQFPKQVLERKVALLSVAIDERAVYSQLHAERASGLSSIRWTASAQALSLARLPRLGRDPTGKV